MNLRLIEPLKDFFKDEVRKLGNSLGLVKIISQRHPFPGPGLGIRILGNITYEKIKILQAADDIYISELIKKIFIIKSGKHTLLYYHPRR